MDYVNLNFEWWWDLPMTGNGSIMTFPYNTQDSTTIMALHRRQRRWMAVAMRSLRIALVNHIQYKWVLLWYSHSPIHILWFCEKWKQKLRRKCLTFLHFHLHHRYSGEYNGRDTTISLLDKVWKRILLIYYNKFYVGEPNTVYTCIMLMCIIRWIVLIIETSTTTQNFRLLICLLLTLHRYFVYLVSVIYYWCFICVVNKK